MITVKKALCMVLIFSLLIPVLVSCHREEDEYPFESLLSEESVTALGYRIVVPANCSALLYGRAEELAALLSDRIGASVTIAFDGESLTDTDVPELLLGYTSRPASQEWMASFRKDDYICRADGEGTIVIGGRSDAATLTALERFCSEILPFATADAVMREDGGFSFVATYETASILLNGFDLGLYCLVIPKNMSRDIRDMGSILRDRIAEESGYVLPIFSQTDEASAYKTIRLSELSDSRQALAYLSPDETGIEIGGYGSFGFSVALSTFESYLLAGERTKTHHCDIFNTISIPYEQDEYRIATVQGSGWSTAYTPVGLSKILAPVQAHMPDQVIFDGAQGALLDRLIDSLSHLSYGALTTSDGSALPALTHEESARAVLTETVADGALTMTLYRLGSEKFGFTLLHVGGIVTEDEILELPEAIGAEGAPMVVLIHAKKEDGTLSFPSNLYGMRGVYNEIETTEGGSYLFQCYATEGALEVTLRNQDASVGYREISVKRLSVYS